jgi:hypothetical protein
MSLHNQNSKFVSYFLDFYRDSGDDITPLEACKYTKMYKTNFPNLWGGGDSLDREKVYELFLMGRADAITKEVKQIREVK